MPWFVASRVTIITSGLRYGEAQRTDGGVLRRSLPGVYNSHGQQRKDDKVRGEPKEFPSEGTSYGLGTARGVLGLREYVT